MQDFLPFIVIGIATGAVYGLAGVGLVLAYKTSGIFNLAYGAIAALTVFVFYWLHDEHGWPWGLAAAVCVLVIGPAEGLLMELLGRALERVGATLKVVATVGEERSSREVRAPLVASQWKSRTSPADSAGNQTPAPAWSATRSWGRPYPAGKEKAVLVRGTVTGTVPTVRGAGRVAWGRRWERPRPVSPAAMTAARTSAETTGRRWNGRAAPRHHDAPRRDPTPQW